MQKMKQIGEQILKEQGCNEKGRYVKLGGLHLDLVSIMSLFVQYYIYISIVWEENSNLLNMNCYLQMILGGILLVTNAFNNYKTKI